ncbi:MAG TPA: polysaccharide deacetylase family protein [Bryobacteraceae bacterium]|nr:polysaccharide deacetylase family protein [Bryobacteraceae bacterium]
MTAGGIGAVAVGAVACAAGAIAYAVRAPSSTLVAPSVHRGVRSRRSVALTFDDGPSESTPKLLRVLDEHRIRATFFQCGASVRRLPSIAREIASAGHVIGNHSENHARLYLQSASFIYRELADAQESIERVIGQRPRYFRPPFGVRWFGLAQAQRSLGLTSILWSTIGKDWKLPAERVLARLLRGAANGAIFCLHDGRNLEAQPNISVTIEAVRRLAPMLLERGFRFETVSDILCPTTT